MRLRKTTASLGAVGALMLALFSAAPSANADPAPTADDVVGVGSDTLQYIGDFIADGDIFGDTGYNQLGNLNRIYNFDATPDANSRVAYGPNGIGTGNCTPGTGGTAGTANQTTTHGDTPCFLNPTIVLRAGTRPVLRPNGSGSGYDALLRDTRHLIDYSRSSACQGSGTGCRGKVTAGYDSIQVGSDPFNIWVADTTHAVPLSAPQLKAIYEASSPNCLKWTDVGGSSTDPIIPIVPQTGSGTFASFKASIGLGTLGNCGVQFEENDPTAIYQVSNSADAIEPISGARMNLYLGKFGNGASTGQPGYFNDPSCPVEATAPAQCADSGNGIENTVEPAVHNITSGTPSDSQPLWNINRPVYIYFRDSDVGNTAPYGADHPFQPGGTLNWVRTLFYNPCSAGQTGCVTVSGNLYGPGGPPFYATAAGRALISAAGFNPAYVVTLNGP